MELQSRQKLVLIYAVVAELAWSAAPCLSPLCCSTTLLGRGHFLYELWDSTYLWHVLKNSAVIYHNGGGAFVSVILIENTYTGLSTKGGRYIEHHWTIYKSRRGRWLPFCSSIAGMTISWLQSRFKLTARKNKSPFFVQCTHGFEHDKVIYKLGPQGDSTMILK